jgi:hypothetical protein
MGGASAHDFIACGGAPWQAVNCPNFSARSVFRQAQRHAASQQYVVDVASRLAILGQEFCRAGLSVMRRRWFCA